MRQFIAALVAALSLSVPLAASAQDQPSYATASGEGQIRGRIVSFDGVYNVQVRDDKGYVDNVELHQGTIINPTGLTLASGMVVSILGYNAGSYFAANEIDTPYTFYSGLPYYGGHPWNYYGPSIGLSFFFGNPGWWHGASFYGPYRSYGGVRVYNNVHYNTVYRGGNYQGRDYAAEQHAGGYYPRGGDGGYRGEAGNRGAEGGDRGEGGNRGGDGGNRRDGGGEHGGYRGGGDRR